MNTMKNYILLLFPLLFLACSTNNLNKGNDSTNSNIDANQVTDLDVSLDLSDHLRKIPGVQVKGNGATANIKIRGSASVALNEEPLIVLDDRPMQNYAQVFSIVNVVDIKSIDVLKNASETGFYGSRGAAGVILIKTKNN